MNSHKRIIVGGLFILSLAPVGVTASDPGCDCIQNQTPCCNKDTYEIPCVRDNVCDKENVQAQLREGNIHHKQNCNGELQDEIEKSGKRCQGNQDQQADILEKLLLESTTSGINPPRP
jgi:hypothetical protein